MATIDVCDVCGKKCSNRVFFKTDRVMDAAGSMEDEGEVYDLCPTHEIIILKKVLFNGTNEHEKMNINKKIIKEIEKLRTSSSGQPKTHHA